MATFSCWPGFWPPARALLVLDLWPEGWAQSFLIVPLSLFQNADTPTPTEVR